MFDVSKVSIRILAILVMSKSRQINVFVWNQQASYLCAEA